MTTPRTFVTALWILFVALCIGGCAGFVPGSEPPAVSVTSFALAPESSGSTPRFNIGIRVVNPNRNPIRLRGMSYSVEIDGNRILNGANPDLPTVPGYDSADFVIQASPDLLGGVRLLTDLFSRQRNTLGYTFRARIDVGSLLPLTIEESGQFNLPAAR